MCEISLCMIVKNEEEVIGRCLESVKNIVDELIIVDTGSTDSTIEIIKKYTDKVYMFNWIDDFSEARNFSFSKATKDYIMWLDADDVILEEDKIKLLKLKDDLKEDIDMVMMKYNITFDKDNNPIYSYYRERLFFRNKNYKWIGAIHEVIVPSGNILYSDIAISHKKIKDRDPKRNLRIFNKLIDEGKKLNPREQFYYARELYYDKQYDKASILLNKFLDDKNGWKEDCISACIDLANCYNELNNKNLAFKSLLRSFEFDKPRAEVCCEIGQYFLKKQDYEIAVFWYELAGKSKIDDSSLGFYNLDCYGYIPYIQLCVCYHKLGKNELSIFYNNKAGELKPNDSSFLHNKKYFNKKK